jgi:hypothetical protein
MADLALLPHIEAMRIIRRDRARELAELSSFGFWMLVRCARLAGA